MPAVTLRDIARHTNLDISTVSRVLNDDKSVRIAPERREHVIRVAAELGYVPHRNARALRLNRTFNVGYVLRDLEYPLARLRLYGLVGRLEQDDYLLSLLDAHQPALLDPKGLRGRSVEGIVWNNLSPSMETDLLRLRLPVVLIDPFGQDEAVLEQVCIVGVDRGAGVRRAMEYLAGQGHRRIAFVSAHTNVLRLAGYRDAVALLGLADDPTLVRLYDAGGRAPTNVRGCGYSTTRDMLESGVAFTAILAGNDSTAAGVIDALREADRSVPEDVAVVGYDDIEDHGISLFTEPFLTTIRDPNREMGVLAAELMIGAIERGATCETVVVQPELVLRRSA